MSPQSMPRSRVEVATTALELAGRHRGLDFLALRGGERAVMQRDGERFFVGAPEFLEHVFRLHARVDEDEGQAMGGDRFVNFGNGVVRGMSGPRHVAGGFEDADHRLGSARDRDEIGHIDLGFRRELRNEICAQLRRPCHGRRETNGHRVRGEAAKARQIEGEQIAALRGRERVQLVENDRIEIGEEIGGVGVAEQQRHLLGGGQEDVWRLHALALSPGEAGIAGACFGADLEAHLGDRCRKVTGDIGRERLQGRDVERFEPRAFAGALLFEKRYEAREKSGERLAGAGRSYEQRRALVARGVKQRDLMRTRCPAAGFEPGAERRRQEFGGGHVDFARVPPHPGPAMHDLCLGPFSGHFPDLCFDGRTLAGRAVFLRGMA